MLSWYARALAGDGIRRYGNYNVNIVLPDAGVVVRIPIEGGDARDLRLWPEPEALSALAPLVPRMPRLLHRSSRPPFQVHTFIAGTTLHDLAPRGRAVPAHVISDVVELMELLCRIPAGRVPPPPAGWPRTTAGFARLVAGATQHVADQVRASSYAPLYERLAIPDDPLAILGERWPEMAGRRFAPVHCDLHRKNLIVADGGTFFIDWELCLPHGDPVYDLAVHLSKMCYRGAEEDAVLRAWSGALPAAHIRGWEHDLRVYRAHETVKTALVDSFRYAKLIAAGADAAVPLASLTAKVNAAHEVWGTGLRLSGAAVGEAVSAVLAAAPPRLTPREPASDPRRPAIGGVPSP
ncbi:aminoglycoside phosphotransferase family protein [Actinomadura sp. ATCC 31491]|uniref:Aminoglycoside phosphotransferase family protein n=1 Tax=Actinomadura luzonensis TaxID=2805427 RepID=A0ABT0FN73_9ACTN|nr:aminoglycoside phosphotransferase family protein [Actinomadura luzonensis]MCK2213741.1 aminoglycoside phosphotransferase family protein [Actinomadura luzonensis]